MNYSIERITAKFEQLSGRKPTTLEVDSISASSKTLTESICSMLNIASPNVLVTAGAHCKSCDNE